MPVLAISTLISCGGGNSSFDVTISQIEGLTIDKAKAKKGEDFTAQIKLDNEGFILPLELASVTIGGNEAKVDEVYTYKLEDDTTATFTIPATNVTGNIDIKLSIDYTKVNEEEFNKAIDFVDVEYLQAIRDGMSFGFVELSPTVSHCIWDADGYIDTYVKRSGSPESYTYEGYERKAAEGAFSPLTPKQAEEAFTTPQNKNIIIRGDLGGKTFEEFEYETNRYTVSFQSEVKISASVLFRNKKASVFTRQAGDNQPAISVFTYEEYTPDFPPQPIGK